jgi:HEAT repeat protein
MAANRNADGTFKAGSSGNPGGRPKVVGEVRDLAREHTEDAINTLAKIMDDEKAPAAARVSAAESILSRGWGKAPQYIEETIRDEREGPPPVNLAALLTEIEEEQRAQREASGESVSA